MAYTKIHAITATVDKAVAYICNPDKTDESIYISSYACAPETAAIDFKYTLDHCRENSPNKAYHLIQAFAPGEVSFEEAHRIGKELADKVLEGKYSYIVTTHIDKGHVHNHIIFCAADNLEHNKYHDCKQTYYRIRKLSDELCNEHNLSVIIPGGERGKKYNEWQSDKNGSAWKTQIRKDINAAIKSSSTYEEFLLLMRAKGYEIKGENFGEDTPKYISFRPLGKDRFVRGSVKSLGREYTKERIKIAAQTYNEAGTIKELEQKIATTAATGKEAKQIVRKLENRIKDLAEIIKYAEQYKANKSYNIAYKKAKNPDAYFRKHESQIILYGGARRMLEQAGISLKGLNIDKLKAEYQELTTQKKELTATYKNCDKELKSLNRKLENLNQYLGRTEPQKGAPEQPDRNNTPAR